MTPGKPELLPSAVPSARHFSTNGKEQSLRLVHRSSCSSAGMDRAVLDPPGRKIFPWCGACSLEWHPADFQLPWLGVQTPDIPALKGASWQGTEIPQDTDFTNILSFRLCFHGSLGVGFSAPQLPRYQKSLFVPLLRFNAASIPKFQTWVVPSTSFW